MISFLKSFYSKKVGKNGFTMIELLIVVIIIAIVAVSISRLYTNQTVVENQAKITNNITMLKYSIGNLPQDINNIVIDNMKDFKQVNSVILLIGKNGIENYKYITLNDYKNKLYNNDSFLGFTKAWAETLDYDKEVDLGGTYYPLLTKKKDLSTGLERPKFTTKLTDFYYLKSCKTYKNNDPAQEINFDLEHGDKIELLLTHSNTFLITDNNNVIDGNNNVIVKRIYCQLMDFMGNEHKLFLVF